MISKFQLCKMGKLEYVSARAAALNAQINTTQGSLSCSGPVRRRKLNQLILNVCIHVITPHTVTHTHRKAPTVQIAVHVRKYWTSFVRSGLGQKKWVSSPETEPNGPDPNYSVPKQCVIISPNYSALIIHCSQDWVEKFSWVNVHNYQQPEMGPLGFHSTTISPKPSR